MAKLGKFRYMLAHADSQMAFVVTQGNEVDIFHECDHVWLTFPSDFIPLQDYISMRTINLYVWLVEK